MTEQATPTSPPEDVGQEQQTPKTVAARLESLEALTQQQANKLVAQGEELEKKERTIKKLQGSKDRAKQRLERLQQSRQAGPPGAAQPNADLREFANEKAREALVLRELRDSGLEDLDVEDFEEYETPSEVRSAIRILKLEQQIAAQGQPTAQEVDVEEVVGERQIQPTTDTEALPLEVDTGGPTSPAPAEAELDTPEAMRAQAEALKEVGGPENLKKARWLILQAAYIDPAKTVGRGRGGATEAG